MKHPVLIVFLGICLAVWFGWRTAYPTFAWHQRHTMTVVTPAGEVSGSAVTAMTVWTAPKTLPEAATIGFELTGEATVVEVAPGRYLFALVEGAAGWAGGTYAPLSGETDFRTRMRMVERQRGNPPADMPRDAWPRLVTFDDIADPASVRLVDPDDLASVFGPGVSLKAMTLEVTRDAVTAGRVEAVLPWLEAVGRDRAYVKTWPPGRFAPGDIPPPDYLIGSSAFSTELFK